MVRLARWLAAVGALATGDGGYGAQRQGSTTGMWRLADAVVVELVGD